MGSNRWMSISFRKTGRLFFFEKKRTKKLLFFSRFNLSGHGLDLYAGANLKVFWFFSSEKNILPRQCGRRFYRPALSNKVFVDRLRPALEDFSHGRSRSRGL
jgi:hypothetical protein